MKFPDAVTRNCYMLIILSVLTSFTAAAQIRSDKDLIGKWSASTLKLEFQADGKVLFQMKGGSIPGARYKTSFQNTPALLNIEVFQKSSKLVYQFAIEFINDNAMRLTTFNSDPVHAFDKQKHVVLKKEK